MNAVFTMKLNEMRRLLSEAPENSFANYVTNAEKEFLSGVAKALKKKMGTKLRKVEVKKTSSATWLEVEGEDASDLSFDLMIHVGIPDSLYMVKLFISGSHAMSGHIDETREFKTGVLTTDLAAEIVSEMLR